MVEGRIDSTMTYKAFLVIVIPISVFMTSTMIFFFKTISDSQSVHFTQSLKSQSDQLRLIVDTHSKTPHNGVATESQIFAMEARLQKQTDKMMAGVFENSEAVRQIAELVFESTGEVNGNKMEIERLRDYMKKISDKVGM